MTHKRSYNNVNAWRDPAFLGLGIIILLMAVYLKGGLKVMDTVMISEGVQFQIENAFKLALACVIGSMIGLERGSKNRPAGIRTNALVCTGSTLIMIISFDLFFKYNHLANFDPARLGAQVISGIGFLGAGTIIRDGTTVKGLTTAASLWVVASLGLAIGVGMYIEASLAFLMVYFTLHQLGNMEQRQMLKKANVEFSIITKDRAGQIGEIGQAFGRNGVRITNLVLEREDDTYVEDSEQDDSEICILLSTKLPIGMSKTKLKDDLNAIDGVVSVVYKNIAA